MKWLSKLFGGKASAQSTPPPVSSPVSQAVSAGPPRGVFDLAGFFKEYDAGAFERTKLLVTKMILEAKTPQQFAEAVQAGEQLALMLVEIDQSPSRFPEPPPRRPS